jgi:transcriptional regulator with XRE-family HTH domain
MRYYKYPERRLTHLPLYILLLLTITRLCVKWREFTQKKLEVFMDSIGKKIKYLREKHNISQNKLAEGAGVQRGNISHYEKEDWSPNYDTAKKIAIFFNVDPDWLYYGDENKFRNDDVSYLKYDEVPLEGRTLRILGELNETEIRLIKLFRKLNERDQIKIEGLIEEKIKDSSESKKQTMSSKLKHGKETVTKMNA